MNYRLASAMLANRDKLKLERNTYLERRGPGRIAVRLHETDIVTFAPTWTELNTGGWHTMVTSQRMSTYSPVHVSPMKGGWSVYMSGPLPCYCNEPSYHSGEARRGQTERYVSTRDDGEHVYEWVKCSTCQGTGTRRGFDWASGGYPYFDGIRVNPSGSRLMASQPKRPQDWQPIITVSGFTGLSRGESRRERQAWFDARLGRV